MKRFALFIAIVSSACAARSEKTSDELIQARQEYNVASSGNAAVEAPKSLGLARATLNAAEEAHAQDPGSQHERELAYMALRRAQAAIAEGNARAARHDADAAKNDLRLTSERAAQQAEQARAEADAAKAQAEAEAQQRQAAELAAANQGAQADAAKAQADALRAERDKAEQERAKAQRERDEALASMRRLGDVAEKPDKTLVLTMPTEVMFRPGQARLLTRARAKLDQLAEALLALDTNQSFVIEGHTDSRGSTASNERLSRLRALAVRSYLIKRGVDGDRIQAVGRGEDEPVASNADAEGRAENRRVEIVVTPARVSTR